MYQIVSEENAQPDPKELVQQMLEAGKGIELLEMLENALKENEPAKQKVHPRGVSLAKQNRSESIGCYFRGPAWGPATNSAS